jgi:hypothetical protein
MFDTSQLKMCHGLALMGHQNLYWDNIAGIIGPMSVILNCLTATDLVSWMQTICFLLTAPACPRSQSQHCYHFQITVMSTGGISRITPCLLPGIIKSQPERGQNDDEFSDVSLLIQHIPAL